MPRICISYRRSDSAAISGRIYDHLVRHYGRDAVFMDLSGIPYGADFRKHIEATLSDTEVLIALVGPAWLGRQENGTARIHDRVDPVRAEIQFALRQGILIVPLLVDGAKMPDADELPRNIRDFAFRNAMRVDSGADFLVHVERLIAFLDQALGIAPPSGQPSGGVTDFGGDADLASVAQSPRRPLRAGLWLSRLLPYFAMPVIVLLLAHYLLIMKLDLDPIYLRLVCVLIPLAGGFLLFRNLRLSVAAAAVLGLGVALIVVAGMLTIVGLVDGRSVLPNGAGEWQEAGEYLVSMVLATAAGNVLARALHAAAPSRLRLFFD